MNDNKKVYYLKNKHNEQIAFFPTTRRFFKINPNGKNFIDDVVSGFSSEEIQKKFEIDEKEYEKLYSKLHLNDCIEAALKHDCTSLTQKDNSKILNRLVIHVTNTCNLRCVYCYANGGSYFSDHGVMTTEVLDKILEVFYTYFEKILTIQFFGGEPLLNIPLIEYTCKKIREIEKTRNYVTTFGLITNATLITDEFIDLVKKYNIKVTASYDGDIIVNNLLRKDASGNGVSDKIIENIRKLKSQTDEPNTIEVTYTQLHVLHNIKIIDILKHIREFAPNTYIHLVPAGGTSSDSYVLKDLSEFPKSVDDIFSKFKEQSQSTNTSELVISYSLIDRIINALTNNNIQVKYICDALIGTISVSVKGDVYPCFMFTDQEQLCLGSIFDKDLFTSEKYKRLSNKITNFSSKESNEECKSCMINSFCNGCLGLNSYASGSVFELSKKICDMYREMAKRVIINLSEYYSLSKSETKGS